MRSTCRAAVQIGEPKLDEGADGVLETGLACRLERPFVALADLLGSDALLQPVVAGHEQPLDPRARLIACSHGPEATPRSGHGARRAGAPRARRNAERARRDGYHPRSMIPLFAVLQVLLGAALVTLVLMHSGRDAGFGGIGFTPTSQGGTHIVEKNLTRLTVAIGILFTLNTIALYRVLA
jgi:preprotein translocase subunit SecG